MAVEQGQAIRERLKGFDFNRLGERESRLVQQLAGFSYQQSFLDLLRREYGNTNMKEKFIDTNHMYLDSEDTASLNAETMKYKKQTGEGSLAIIGTCTFGALIFGVFVLPARRSPIRYTVGGFGLGVVLAYGFWRLQLNQYDKKVNHLFRKIVQEQYVQRKGTQL